MTIAVRELGLPAELVPADAQERAVDRRHAFDGPVLGVLPEQRVDLVAVRVDAAHEPLGVGIGWRGSTPR